MSEFKREERYIVVKLKHLAGLQVAPLRNFLRENRVPTLDCVVVESDWPEYEKVWQSIERRMTGQPAITAAEELDAVLHWRGKHTQAIRERDALQQLLNQRDEQVETLKMRRQGEPVAWLNVATGQVTTSSVVVMDWDDEKEQVQSLYAERPAPVAAAQIAGFNIIEDPSIPPGQIRMCDCNQGRMPCTCKPSAYDGFDNGVD